MGSVNPQPHRRPDLSEIRRQPMARVGPAALVARRGAHRRTPPRLFSTAGTLDIDTLHRLLEAAQIVTEGQVYAVGSLPAADAFDHGEATGVFMGSSLITIDLGSLRLQEIVDDGLAHRLRDALVTDSRAHHVVRDHVYRESARLLGPDTPAHLDVVQTASYQGLRVLIDVDFEAPVEVLPSTSSPARG